MTDILLEVQQLNLYFTQYEKGLRQRELHTLSDLSLSIGRGEMVAVVGASGAGKSLLAHAILGLLPGNARTEGTLLFRGERLTEVRQKALRGREMVLVPQGISYLDPLMRVLPQLTQGRKDAAVKERALQLLDRYGLSRNTADAYPFALSGGMARRVLIATAQMGERAPALVVADEPTPGLHREAALRVLGHFREMKEQGAGVLLITHDLERALEVADRVVVLYAGTAVEEALAQDFQAEGTLRHPYTKALYRAMPKHGWGYLPGQPPLPHERGSGCAFGPRCPERTGQCDCPVPYRAERGGRVRCLLGEEASHGA